MRWKDPLKALDLDDSTIEAGHHVVQFYDHAESLALAVSSFVGAGLVDGEAALVVATAEHRSAFEAILTAAGIDVAAATRVGAYVTLDAEETLGTFMVGGLAGGMPDPDAFRRAIGTQIERSAARGPAVRIYGEMVAVLWAAGNVLGAMAVEELWNELATTHRFTLYCAYPASAMSGGEHRDLVCRHHSAVVPDPQLQEVSAERAVRRFEPTIFAVRAARRFVADTLHVWGREDLRSAAELVVSELATNASLHVGRRFIVELTQVDHTVRVAVLDRSHTAPAPTPDWSADATSGRGMHLVEALSERWGTDLREDGKVVWAEVRAEVRADRAVR